MPIFIIMSKVSIMGSGNWGSAIAKIVGINVAKYEEFDNTVRMYVHEEVIDGENLSEIINHFHVNVKYLPGFELPHNVVAVTDALEAAEDADILIWVLPHKFVRSTCAPLVGKIKPTAIALSLIKGFDIHPETGGGIALMSNVLRSLLNIEVSVMMGANLANEVASEKFCESTMGCRDASGGTLKKLLQTDYFRITVIDDVETIEVCGAVKNIVAIGSGIVDGLGLGNNTKATVLRLGLTEMVKFAKLFREGSRLETFFESCGIADLVTSCYGGRNRRVAEAFVKSEGSSSFKELEREMLDGQHLQGPQTAEEVFVLLESKGLIGEFPLFVAVHRICVGEIPPNQLIDSICNN